MTTVLIVEDDTDIRAAYAYGLSKAGFKVYEAAHGGEALDMLDGVRPDVILLDMLMPGVSGVDFLKQAQIASRLPNTKVIAFSNIDSPNLIEQARSLGVDEYLIKVEVTPHQMVQMINDYFNAPPAPSLKPAI